MLKMQPRSLTFNLEPTFRCNLECAMCPRFSSEDPHLDMTLQTYARIIDAAPFAHTIDFTGWGEPTLNENIYTMTGMAKDAGCVTAMTTNGTTLTGQNQLELLDSGLDRLVVSVDGVTPETYDAIRIGTSFERIESQLRQLCNQVSDQRASLEVGVAFTLQESNAGDLERLVPWLAGLGVQVLHFKHLNVVSNVQDWQNGFLKYSLSRRRRRDGVLRELEARIRRVAGQAERAGIKTLMHSELPLRSKMEPRHCLAAPMHATYFAYDGRVAPCCHFGHHVTRHFEGISYPPSSFFVGDITRQPFGEIWTSATYRAFRDGFEERLYPEACRTCHLLYGK